MKNQTGGYLNLNESFEQTFNGLSNLNESENSSDVHVIILHVGERKYKAFENKGYSDDNPEYMMLKTDSIDYLVFDNSGNFKSHPILPNEKKYLGKTLTDTKNLLLQDGFVETKDFDEDILESDQIADIVSVPEGLILCFNKMQNLNESEHFLARTINPLTIFRKLNLLDDMELNMPSGKAGRDLDYLNDLFNSSTELSFSEFCEELFVEMENLNKIGIYNLNKQELKSLKNAFDKNKQTMLNALNNLVNQSAFKGYTGHN